VVRAWPGEGEEPALPLPPSLTAAEAHLLPMERTSLMTASSEKQNRYPAIET
jgi:hypothetical protein